jgi:hypothetical protein
MKIYIGKDKGLFIISSGPLEWDGEWFQWVDLNGHNRCLNQECIDKAIYDYIIKESGIETAPVGFIGELEI